MTDELMPTSLDRHELDTRLSQDTLLLLAKVSALEECLEELGVDREKYLDRAAAHLKKLKSRYPGILEATARRLS